MDKVCIVILNYNNFEDTIECVQSLRSTIKSNEYDIVIVDNNSVNDSVKELSRALSPIKIISSLENRGYANGNNIGIKYAEDNGYDYICILNNDTLIEVDFLESCKRELEEDSSVAFVSPVLVEYKNNNLVQSTGGDIFINRGIVTLKNHGAQRDKLPSKIESDYIGGACLMFKTSILNIIGYIPESYFLFYEETEWCYRAKKLGYKNICLTKSYVYHKGSVSIKAVNGLQEYLMARNRVVFVRRNVNSKLRYTVFLFYLFLQQLYHCFLRRDCSRRKYKYYLDGVFNRIDPSYPFIFINE